MSAPDSFEYAKEMTTQMITLSTAVIGVSVTFAKDVEIGISGKKRLFLFLSWGAFLVSILFGILTLGSLTGLLAQNAVVSPKDVYDESVKFKSMAQWGVFLVGVLLLILDAILTPKRSDPHRALVTSP